MSYKRMIIAATAYALICSACYWDITKTDVPKQGGIQLSPPAPVLTPDALLERAYQYLRGNQDPLVAQNYTLARTMFEQAAQTEDLAVVAVAYVELGNIYYEGLGVAQNDQRARDYYLQATTPQMIEADYEVAIQAFQGLGDLYMGEGPLHSLDLARQYYIRATQVAQDEDRQEEAAYAYGQLGDMYYEGDGVAISYAQAAHYYQWAAAAQGDYQTEAATAQARLGDIYYIGLGGILVDYNRARGYFEALVENVAGEAWWAHAWLRLGQMYYLGHGVEQDHVRARVYFEQVINDENAFEVDTQMAQNYLNQMNQ